MVLKLILADFISESFIVKYPEIFVTEIDEEIKSKTEFKEGLHTRIIENINILDDNNFDTLGMSKKNSDIFLIDEEKLKESLLLIKKYDLDYSNSTNFELLKDNSLITVADRLIELGLREHIKSHPQLISYKAQNRLNRMELCKLLDIPLLIDNKLNPLITNIDFIYGKNIIRDEDINDYIPNSTTRYLNESCYEILMNNKNYNNYDEEIPILEKYKANELEYNIDGIIISRNKVLRNYRCLKNSNLDLSDEELLFNSIIFNSILDEENIETIKKAISKKEKIVNK